MNTRIQTFKFDSPYHAVKFITYLVAAKIQFTHSFDVGQIHICYPIAEEAGLPPDFEDAWKRIVSAIEKAAEEAVL